MKVEEVEVTKETEKQVTATHSEVQQILAEASADMLHELGQAEVIDDAPSHMFFTMVFAKLCSRMEKKLFKEEK